MPGGSAHVPLCAAVGTPGILRYVWVLLSVFARRCRVHGHPVLALSGGVDLCGNGCLVDVGWLFDSEPSSPSDQSGGNDDHSDCSADTPGDWLVAV